MVLGSKQDAVLAILDLAWPWTLDVAKELLLLRYDFSVRQREGDPPGERASAKPWSAPTTDPGVM
jgi:hypothetical protein